MAILRIKIKIRHVGGTYRHLMQRLTRTHTHKKAPVPTQEGVTWGSEDLTGPCCEIHAWVGEQLAIHNTQCRQGIQWTDTQNWMTPFSIKHSEGSNTLIWPRFHLALLMHDNCRAWCAFVTVKHYHFRCSEWFVNCGSKLLLPFLHPSQKNVILSDFH